MRTFTFDTIADYRAAKATSGSGNVIYQALVGDTSVYSGSVVSKIKTGETFVDSINPFVTPDLGTDGDTLYKITDNGVVKYMYLRKGKTTWDSESFGQVFIKTDRLPTGSYTQVTNPSQVFTYADTKSEATGSGRARIAKIKGNSLAWNQIVQAIAAGTYESNSVTLTVNADGTMKLNGTASALAQFNIATVSRISGHKYAIITNGLSGSTTGVYFNWDFQQAKYITESEIYTAPSTAGAVLRLRATSGTACSNLSVSINIFDLTLMFGAGNEPATVEEFEALFPNPYYAYDAGSLLNFKGKWMKVAPLGLNIWDEEWEVGAFNGSGQKLDTAITYLRSATPIPVKANTEYYFRTPRSGSSGHANAIFFYDASMAYLSLTTKTGSTTFTTPDNCAYINIQDNYGSSNPTYANDICVNLSGPRNGQYEPYKSSIIPINITSLRDKATHNLIFPNGLLSAGTVYDEIDLVRKKANKIGLLVHLGDLNWTDYDNTYNNTTAIISPSVVTVGRTAIANITCPRYTITSYSERTSKDKTLTLHHTNSIAWINDSSFVSKTGAHIKADLNGVYAIFELATPVEYDLSIPLFGTYPADEYVTKQLLPINGETPTTSPMSIEIQQL